MLMLLAAAQIHGAVVAVLDMQPDRVLIELAASIEIGHVKHGVTAPDDVEGRIEDVLRNGHAVSLIELVIPGWSEGPGPESRGSGFASRPGMTVSLDSQSLYLVRPARQRDVLGFHVEVERIVAAVAADAGGFHAPKWRRQMADVFGIEPDHAGFQRVRDSQRTAHIAGPDIAGEAILHGIGDLDRVILIAERDHREERAEYFLLRHAHLGMRAGDERRLHVVSAAGSVMRLAADRNHRAVQD